MLTSPGRGEFDDFAPASRQQPTSVYVEIERILAAARRQLWVVALAGILGGVAGVLFLATRTPNYTASALVLIDNRRVRAVENAYDTTLNIDIAASLVDSQVEVVKAAQVSEAVIRKLNLLSRPEFNTKPKPPGLIQQLKNALFGSPNEIDSDVRSGESAILNDPLVKMNRAIEQLQWGLDVRRVGRTMVLQISYTSPSRASAAEFANAYAEAYLADQLNAKFEATKRASDWLGERLAELKEKALNADSAVQKFRAANGLISSGGKLVNEQQLTEINTQLVVARGERARAEARYERISQIIKMHETKSVISEAIGNTIIEQLRAKYLDVSKREAELTAKLGDDHLSVVGLRAEMAQYEKQMFAELGRIAEGYRSEVDIARAKEASLLANLNTLVGVSAKENQSLVTLRELEREGDAFRNLYQSYMQRYQESLQQQSFPIIEARIITAASQPLKPSSPKKAATLIIFLFLGGALGGVAGAIREFREKGFRREEQVWSELGIESLGIVPFVKAKDVNRIAASNRMSSQSPKVTYSQDGAKPKKAGFSLRSVVANWDTDVPSPDGNARVQLPRPAANTAESEDFAPGLMGASKNRSSLTGRNRIQGLAQ